MKKEINQLEIRAGLTYLTDLFQENYFKPTLMLKNLLVIIFLSFSLFAFGANGLVDAGTPDFLTPPKISVYPNPTSDFFGVTDATGIVSLKIYNLLGKEMRSFQVEDGLKYNISDLPNGMYLIQLINNKKKIVNTQRLQKR